MGGGRTKLDGDRSGHLEDRIRELGSESLVGRTRIAEMTCCITFSNFKISGFGSSIEIN